MTTTAQTDTPRRPGRTVLFKAREKVYPKAVRGRFRRLKWAALFALLVIYYTVPWLRWDRGPDAPDQAVLIDMAGQRAYFFFIEIWPQEVYYLTGLLVMAAIGLFLVTSLAGRLWCGYACPQTVWTDLFMWVERRIEGDRSARIRLDRSPMSVGKALRKLAKHAAWLLIALLTGGSWVLYFNDAPTLAAGLLRWEVPGTVVFFVGLFTATTYLLAGWAREQVCTYMCPWPRIQAAMVDEDSLIVTYQAHRGEARGPKRKSQSWEGRGDCIDCGECVKVCPVGIDIRDGQQLECIGCGLCIDACDTIMDRIGRPRDLIRFDTYANQVARAAGRPPRTRLVRPRTVAYALMLLAGAALMAGMLVLRPRLEVGVLRDRAPLYVVLADGSVRNAYTLRISNLTREARTYALTLAGVPAGALSVVGAEASALSARPDQVSTYRVFVTAPGAGLAASTPLVFELRDRRTGETARYDSVFLAPSD
jgi:cytochrome c oxidase accessory protein FixG